MVLLQKQCLSEVYLCASWVASKTPLGDIPKLYFMGLKDPECQYEGYKFSLEGYNLPPLFLLFLFSFSFSYLSASFLLLVGPFVWKQHQTEVTMQRTDGGGLFLSKKGREFLKPDPPGNSLRWHCRQILASGDTVSMKKSQRARRKGQRSKVDIKGGWHRQLIITCCRMLSSRHNKLAPEIGVAMAIHGKH